MAAWRKLEKEFNSGRLNPATPGAMSVLNLVRSEWQLVMNESVNRKHRAETAERELQRTQNELAAISASSERWQSATIEQVEERVSKLEDESRKAARRGCP